MDAYIKRHALNTFKKNGYQELDNFYYSLSYSQGDGICCAGYVSTDECVEKADSVMSPSDRKKLKAFLVDEQIYIEVSHSGRNYHSKSLRYETMNTGDADEDMYELIDKLVCYISDEVTGILDSIEADCYAIIEAMPADYEGGAFEIKNFKTERLRLEVRLEHCDSADDCVAMWDESIIDASIERMIAGELVHGAIYMALFMDDKPYCYEFLGSTQLVKKKDKYPLVYHEYVRGFLGSYGQDVLEELGIERSNKAERAAGRVARADRREAAIVEAREAAREQAELEKQLQEDAMFASLWTVSTNNPLTLNL